MLNLGLKDEIIKEICMTVNYFLALSIKICKGSNPDKRFDRNQELKISSANRIYKLLIA